MRAIILGVMSVSAVGMVADGQQADTDEMDVRA
jgi:hypothetical protein